MQPMQQVMSEAEDLLATEPKVGFNVGQAKEELIKVNVCTLTEFTLSGYILVVTLTKNFERWICLLVSLPIEND